MVVANQALHEVTKVRGPGVEARIAIGECGWDRDKRDWENVGGIGIRGTGRMWVG